jgi:hypothetical protein
MSSAWKKVWKRVRRGRRNGERRNKISGSLKVKRKFAAKKIRRISN